jgi:C4-dicarboxylate-specific signal transduction histidine kinase
LSIIRNAQPSTDPRLGTLTNGRGSGIAAEHPDRVLYISFTTKLNRMGLGLAICRSIVTGMAIPSGHQTIAMRELNSGSDYRLLRFNVF